TSAGPATILVPGSGIVKVHNQAEVGSECGVLRIVSESGLIKFSHNGDYTLDACTIGGLLNLGGGNNLRGHFVGDLVSMDRQHDHDVHDRHHHHDQHHPEHGAHHHEHDDQHHVLDTRHHLEHDDAHLLDHDHHAGRRALHAHPRLLEEPPGADAPGHHRRRRV